MKRDQLRSKIAAANDRPLTKIEAGQIDGWDFDVYLRKLSGADGNDLSAVFTQTKAEKGEGAGNVAFCDRLLVRSLTDEDGVRLFADDEAHLINERGSDAVKFLTQKAMEINKLDKVSQDNAVKPSDSAPTS